jgi:DNA polymerase III sliding clamp (beta) subunit (PCNA family)
MKKLKNEIDWLNLAVGKDVSRDTLCEIYIDNGTAVATDGHRLHLIEDFKPNYTGYLGNAQADFPDYKQVLLVEATELCIIGKDCAFKIIKFLESIIKLSDQKRVVVELLAVEGYLQVKYKDTWNEACHKSCIPCRMEYSASFNAQYLIDALSICQLHLACGLRINKDFPQIEISLGKFKSILMPVKVK